MKVQVAAGLVAVICAGCATEPATYVGSLNPSDRKWQSAACRDARNRAVNYEVEEKERLKSLAMVGLFSPSSTLATVDVANRQNVRRKQFNRDLHLACSGSPLPDDLTNIPEIQPVPMADTSRGN